MSKLLSANGDDVSRALRKAGFELDHWSGSHAIMFNPSTVRTVSVPCHRKDLQPGILHGLIKDAGLSVEQFRRLLK